MSLSIFGYKCGMTRLFDAGCAVPISVLKFEKHVVVRVKNKNRDGYDAIQVTFGKKLKLHKCNKSYIGSFKRFGCDVGLGLWEFRVKNNNKIFKQGDVFDVSIFKGTKFVNVSAISKGKGFSGVVKRHNFSMQRASHGNSLSHRVPGSIGQCQTPGRVFKGKKMPEHLGNSLVTVKNLKIFEVCSDKNILLLKGAVPGFVGSLVTVSIF